MVVAVALASVTVFVFFDSDVVFFRDITEAFEADAFDLALTLRRSLSLKGNAQISTTPEPTTAASTGFDTAQRTRQGVAGSSPVRVKVRYRATTPEPGAVKSSDTRAGTPPLRVNV